jgi:hypothetical protein
LNFDISDSTLVGFTAVILTDDKHQRKFAAAQQMFGRGERCLEML